MSRGRRRSFNGPRYVRVTVDIHDVAVVGHFFERHLRDEGHCPADLVAQFRPALNRHSRSADIAVPRVELGQRVLNIDLVLVSEAVRSGFANRSGRRVVRVQERDEAEAMRLAPAIPTNNSESVSIAFFHGIAVDFCAEVCALT